MFTRCGSVMKGTVIMRQSEKLKQAIEAAPDRQLDRQTSILIVEKNLDLRRAMVLSLQALGLKVSEASSAAAAREILNQFAPDILIIDFDYPEGHNAAIIKTFRERRKPLPGSVIVTTTQRLTEDWRERSKPNNVLFKPFDMRHLYRILSQHLVEHTGTS